MTNNIQHTVSYGRTEIKYSLLLMRRKTMQVAVYPDYRVIVKAPLGVALDDVAERVQRKARWISRKLAYFRQLEPRATPRKYVSGESHLYLGRRYRLKLIKADADSVLLKGGYFFIHCRDRRHTYVKKLLDQWYRHRAGIVFPEMLAECWAGFQRQAFAVPELRMRNMKTRWGSLSSKGRMTLNTKLMQAPKDCIEYVIVHELCHLAHRNHGRGFYQALETAMPDWAKRKHKLELALA